MLTSDVYHKRIRDYALKNDSNQLVILQSFDDLNSLCHRRLSSGFHKILHVLNTFFVRPFGFTPGCSLPGQGIYLWGSVGVGKTLLMDCFFDSLPTSKKRRIHFHQFMQEVHAKLQQYSGHVNPLRLLVKNLHSEIEVLCLDEFFVSDIVDAMLLAGLLEAMFKEGIIFVTTSNVPPEGLYKHGLRRDNFLPAIALLQKNLEVLHLNSGIDYRFQHLKTAGVYYSPLNDYSERQMHAAFELYANQHISVEPLLLLGRKVAIIKSCEQVVWFDFEVLCGPLRCKQDYLALIEQFSVIFLSRIPILNHRQLNEITCFIQLVDILYDAKIKLVASAQALPTQLYTEGKLFFEFQRTISRLTEMQSAEYFSV